MWWWQFLYLFFLNSISNNLGLFILLYNIFKNSFQIVYSLFKYQFNIHTIYFPFFWIIKHLYIWRPARQICITVSFSCITWPWRPPYIHIFIWLVNVKQPSIIYIQSCWFHYISSFYLIFLIIMLFASIFWWGKNK